MQSFVQKKTNERKRKTNWEILKFLFSAFVAIVNSGYADICEMSQLIYFCVLLINLCLIIVQDFN